ncbi:MAG: hypothetical protein COA69_10885 [Robiginitomaculum sp.]|nr:MAG: hypothetical protein COA69_10885 [Robiginitomaculum sp.]
MKKWMQKITIYLTGIILGLALIVFMSLKPPSAKLPKRSDRMITGVNILNPGAPVLENQTIIIKDGVITDIHPTQAGDDPAVCPECFVMPGLIDAHIHTPPKIAFGNQELFSLLYLKYGVTSVRDTGQSEESVIALARNLNTQKLVGPRMYSCGPVIDGDPPGWAFSQVATTAQDGVRIVRMLAAKGVDCIKVYNEISKPAFEAIRQEAALQNIPVIGHVPHAVGLAGVHNMQVQHLTGVPYIDGSRPVYGRDYSDADMNALSEAGFIQALDIAKANNISFTPTLSNYQMRLIAADAKRFPPTEGMQHLPEFWNMAFQTVAWHPSNQTEIDARLLAIENSKKFVKAAHENGIDILAGTDTIMPYVVPGESLLIELDILGEVFESTEDALASATTINGYYIDKDKIGVLKVGAYADMLLLTSDPRKDLQAVRDWNFLVVGGRFITRVELDKQVTRFDKHFNGLGYRTIMGIAMAFKASDYAKEKMDDE